MNPKRRRIFALFIATFLSVAVTSLDAATRFSVFRRDPRTFIGVGGGNELYSVNPRGAANLKAALRGLGSINYASGGGSMTIGFNAGRSPKAFTGKNAGSVTLGKARGGALIAIFKDIKRRPVGAQVFHAPSSSASQSGRVTEPSFDLTGFSRFGFNRQQVENDVGLFGEQLSTLIDDDFKQLLLLLQRLSNEINSRSIDVSAVPIAQTILNAGTGLISSLPNQKDILTRPVDLVTNTRQNLADQLATKYPDIIADLFSNTRPTDPFVTIDPNSSGHISLTENAVSFLESTGTVFIYCTRGGGSSGACSARVRLRSQTGTDIATPGKDFVLGRANVSWKAGETGPKAVFLSIIPDRIPENLETFTLECVDVTNALAFSPISVDVGIVDDDRPKGAATNYGFGTSRNTEIICEYRWPTSKKNLDTGTTFYGTVGSTPTSYTLGYNYPNFEASSGPGQVYFAPFMAFASDAIAGNGREVVRIDIDGAVTDGFVTTALSMSCTADWYAPAGGSGPAVFYCYFRDKRTGRTSQITQRQINPSTTAHTGPTTRATTDVCTVHGTYNSSLDFFNYTIDPPSF